MGLLQHTMSLVISLDCSYQLSPVNLEETHSHLGQVHLLIVLIFTGPQYHHQRQLPTLHLIWVNYHFDQLKLLIQTHLQLQLDPVQALFLLSELFAIELRNLKVLGLTMLLDPEAELVFLTQVALVFT
jgi:hypothetical protein